MQTLVSSISAPPPASFDHGAALRVPPHGDLTGWRRLEAWLGDQGIVEPDSGLARILVDGGELLAHSGDWIVLSVRGVFHVARPDRTEFDA